MKYFIYLVLSLLFLKAHCNINECTILQMQDEEICPGMSSICELQVYFFNYPESFPSELMDENLRNKKIARMFKLYTSPNILEKWEKKMEKLHLIISMILHTFQLEQDLQNLI